MEPQQSLIHKPGLSLGISLLLDLLQDLDLGGFLHLLGHCNPLEDQVGGHLDGGVALVPGLDLEHREVGRGCQGAPQARFEHKSCQGPANKS